ncbi:MAG: hypothetical protein ACRD0W_21540 [Acidimicrobiales bacterium]
MALMSPQSVSTLTNATFSAPTTSDTITPDSGLILYVKVGATATTVTMVVPGLQPYTGTAIADSGTGSVTNTERQFGITRDLIDSATGLVNVTYSQVTGVTVALLKAPQL